MAADGAFSEHRANDECTADHERGPEAPFDGAPVAAWAPNAKPGGDAEVVIATTPG